MTEAVVIIDYGSGNLRSAAKAFERAAREAHGGKHQIVVSDDPATVAAADRVILPGVGAFADCMAGLRQIAGMPEALADSVRKRAVPFLGICVGMQLMAEQGLEDGEHAGLGWLGGKVVRLEPRGEAAGMPYKVPHMGWNELRIAAPHPVTDGLADGDHAYFVHSYHMQPRDDGDLAAFVDYGERVTAAVGRENLFGTQFHPEKSQKTGLRLIANFLGWSP